MHQKKKSARLLRPKAISPDDIEIGTKIRLRRIEMRLSQTELADAIGVSFQQIQKYERGHNRVTAARISVLAETLSVPTSFFYESNDASREFSTMLVGEKKSGVRLIQAFSKIKSEIVQRRILAMVEAIAEEQ